jgi:hypothetical protein
MGEKIMRIHASKETSMIGIGVVSIEENGDLWRVALMETPEHQQAGDIREWLSGPLPKSIANDLANRLSKERRIPLLHPEENG